LCELSRRVLRSITRPGQLTNRWHSFSSRLCCWSARVILLQVHTYDTSDGSLLPEAWDSFVFAERFAISVRDRGLLSPLPRMTAAHRMCLSPTCVIRFALLYYRLRQTKDRSKFTIASQASRGIKAYVSGIFNQPESLCLPPGIPQYCNLMSMVDCQWGQRRPSLGNSVPASPSPVNRPHATLVPPCCD